MAAATARPLRGRSIGSADPCSTTVGTLIRRLYAVERKLPPLLPPSDEPGSAEPRRSREEQRRAGRQALPGEPARRPYEVAMACWKKGFYVRYGGDTIQLAPPFISTKEELDRLVSVLGDALNATA